MTIPPIPVENVCANQGELTCYLQAVIKLHVQVKRSHIAIKCGSRCVVRTMLDYLASRVVGHFFVSKKSVQQHEYDNEDKDFPSLSSFQAGQWLYHLLSNSML